MWIVGVNENYYPHMHCFSTEKLAKEYYDKCKNGEEIVYLAEVKDVYCPEDEELYVDNT